MDLLGYGGMSSDETETEATRTSAKQVRRRDRPWRSASLGRMWEAVEDYDVSNKQLDKQRKLGNPGFGRLPPLASKPPSAGVAVRYLPRNFYSPTWWLSQHEHVLSDLSSKPERSLPDYSRYVIYQ